MKHPSYATRLNDLAGLYRDRGDLKAALPLFQQARAIFRASLGEMHPEYATSLNNLAGLLKAMGDCKAALPLFQQAGAITRESLGEMHPSYAIDLNNLAVLHLALGDFKTALPLCQQALAIYKETWGEKHPEYANSLNNLASLRLALGQTEQALLLSEQSLALTRGDLRLAASVQSERQQLAAVQAVRNRLNLRLSLPDSKGEGSASYRHVLLWKGAVFTQQQQRRLFTRLLAADSRSDVRRLVEELHQATRLLAAVALAPADGATATTRREQLEKLTHEKEDLEARLSRLSTEFAASQQRTEVSPLTLRQTLPEGVTLVDFFIYTHHDNPRQDRTKRFTRRLTAYVVRPNRVTVRLDLGPVEPIEEAIGEWRRRLGEGEAGRVAGLKLRRALWLPLEKPLAGAKTVLLSPDGALARLPFAALPGNKPDSYLIEETSLAILAVPQMLPELLALSARSVKPPPSLLVVGDVDFDRADVVMAKAGMRAPPGAR